MIRRPPRSTLFPYNDALPISASLGAAITQSHGHAVRRRNQQIDFALDRLQQPASHARQRRSEEHTSELQSRQYLVCRLLLEKKNIEHPTNERDDYVSTMRIWQ